MTHKPMHQARQALALHPKCAAKCRSGEPCKNPAMKNGRCRMHGGKSTGAPIKHGQRTKAAIAQRKADQALIGLLRKIEEALQQRPQVSDVRVGQRT